MRGLVRIIAACALSAALLGGAAAPAGAHGSGHRHGQDQRPATYEDTAYIPPPPESLGGRFEMIDHRGVPVTDRSYPGKWLLIFFGYAACRETCPLALGTVAEALERLGGRADEVQPLFVDVSLDEPDLVGLEQFVGAFHPALVGLTGTRKQIFDIGRLFRVRREYMHANYSTRETGPRIDHSTNLYLVDPEGVTRAYFYHDVTSRDLARIIRHHVRAGRKSR